MEHGPARRPALPTVSLAAVGAAAVSLAVVAVPWLRMSFEAPGLRVALETGGSLLAVTTVALLVRQCGLRSRADHLWLTLGLVVLAVTSLGVAGLIVAGEWSRDEARYAMGGNLAGTVLLAIAAFAPTGRLRVRARTILLPGALIAAAVFAATALFAGAAPGAGRVPIQVLIAATLVVAALGLNRRANRRNEPLLRWIAVAVVLGGFAKLDYALFPPIGAQNVHLGDVLRILAWAALFVGVLGELRARLRARSEAAVALERRRLARELHDGVAQELAFIRRRAGRLGESADGLEILGAADRALEDSRRAIEALVPPAQEPLDVALERLAARLATECGLEVQVNARAADVSAEVRAELVRIISEATRNAAHHGGARHVRVDVTGTPLAVRIIDDGSGFRDGANSGLGVAGYGLIAMRERAELVGGQFSLESVRGAGTLVQVVLP
ncbi:signal transduction histidine kinase [Solirubrobacter pauli]|uniref:histidine kinase n=1 Tax=Solirubrobacter pauli TaxID=166793 RepID=A0A660L5K0_9ACTN|nr:signal transduction histidine kinase [Solirubrobacter pauli]